MQATILEAEPLHLPNASKVKEISETDLPEGFRVQVVTAKDHELGQSEAGGIIYQKCGGGRRIIRKRI